MNTSIISILTSMATGFCCMSSGPGKNIKVVHESQNIKVCCLFFCVARMRLDLFNEGDNVLILGEGNFSFARRLFAHNLPIKITATCFDNGDKYSNQLENINFLKLKGIPVFLNVDATSLHEHPKLKIQVFSKIIFNFPHVGGKMKIKLNRDLVKKVCESSSQLLNDGGLMIISLCNGQGGTPADNPQRKWDDSWQIAEMAAHGSFCLISVEPFEFHNFESYICTGYRSQDSHFNLKGALVHIFKKKLRPCRIIENDVASQRLNFLPLPHNSHVLVPCYYSEMYFKNPLKNPDSAVTFIKKFLCKCFESVQPVRKLKLMNDENISFFVSSKTGEGSNLKIDKVFSLCSFVAQVIQETIENFKYCTKGEIIFFPGMFFNLHLGQDFSKTPPIAFQFMLVGENISVYFHEFITGLKSLFDQGNLKICNNVIFSETNKFTKESLSDYQDIYLFIENNNCEFVVEWACTNDTKNILAHELHIINEGVALEVFIIYTDKIVEIFFDINSWKETWSEENFVSFDSKSKPLLKQSLIYPLSYKFDITLKYDSVKGLVDDDVYEVLRISAIDMIKNVEVINEYNSGMGWSSKCFRITYQCLNEALHRKKVVDIHTKLIGKMLALALNVTIT